MKKVCVLGTGSWGTALALSLAKIILTFLCGLEEKNGPKV